MAMQFIRKLLFSYYVRIFPFNHSPQWAIKYTFAESTTTVLANCSKKGRVALCVMKSNIRKQSLRKLLCADYVTIFPFSPWAPMGSQISLSRFHEKSVSKLLPEVSVISLWNELTDQKGVSQKASFTFLSEHISFLTTSSIPLRSMPLQISRKLC